LTALARRGLLFTDSRKARAFFEAMKADRLGNPSFWKKNEKQKSH